MIFRPLECFLGGARTVPCLVLFTSSYYLLFYFVQADTNSMFILLLFCSCIMSGRDGSRRPRTRGGSRPNARGGSSSAPQTPYIPQFDPSHEAASQPEGSNYDFFSQLDPSTLEL